MEGRNKNLAADRELQSSVNLCECGVVHLNYFNSTIRFSPKNFLSFALMINEAYYRVRSNPSRSIEKGTNENEALEL